MSKLKTILKDISLKDIVYFCTLIFSALNSLYNSYIQKKRLAEFSDSMNEQLGVVKGQISSLSEHIKHSVELISKDAKHNLTLVSQQLNHSRELSTEKLEFVKAITENKLNAISEITATKIESIANRNASKSDFSTVQFVLDNQGNIIKIIVVVGLVTLGYFYVVKPLLGWSIYGAYCAVTSSASKAWDSFTLPKFDPRFPKPDAPTDILPSPRPISPGLRPSTSVDNLTLTTSTDITPFTTQMVSPPTSNAVTDVAMIDITKVSTGGQVLPSNMQLISENISTSEASKETVEKALKNIMTLLDD